MPKIITKTAIATLFSLGLATAAQATGVALRYNDLDLSTDAGRAELDRRIDRVMRQACPAETITGSRIAVESARAECIAAVRRQIDVKLASRSGGGSSSR